MPLRGHFSCLCFGPHERVALLSIPGPVDGVLRIEFVISRRPEITACLTPFPRPAMLILIVGIAQAKAFMLHLASPATAKRQIGRIATYPLLATRRFDQRSLGIATKPAMLTGNRLRFHAVIGHRFPFFGDASPSVLIGD